MRPSPFGTILATIVLAGTLFVAARPAGPLPALGPLLDPVRGVWSNSWLSSMPASEGVVLPGMTAETRVVYDDRAVPHIFASNTEDAYRALGYAVARDRLFQIELQGRAGAGTLTALVGPAALPVDRDTRRSGMPRAAENRLKLLDQTSPQFRLMQAYVDGANAYIGALAPAQYPIEYKLLGHAPKKLTVLDVMHLFNRMGATLASSRNEFEHLAASSRVGRAAADALFPVHSPIVEPIEPSGLSAPRLDATFIPPPGPPDSSSYAMLQSSGRNGGDWRALNFNYPDNLTGEVGTTAEAIRSFVAGSSRSDDAVGSNNWAVSPWRSAGSRAILAGDPHLELTLPSIWYEVHLVVADSLDVYGVTIPGLPGVVIGFSQAAAWTFTNTGADVMDYYVETVDDSVSPTRYALDGTWRPIERREEKFWGPYGKLLQVDTLRFNHRGPIRKVGSRWISTRWTVLEATRDYEAFDAAARATSASELLDVMAMSYRAPAQNILAADTGGNIAIRSTGRFPLRPGDGRGDHLRDGSMSSSDWVGDWPVADYPQSLNPTQGFLASANQEPFDPVFQPRYFGANWERPWRAIRINTLLQADSSITPDRMRQFQADPGSARADVFVPAFIAASAATTEAGNGDARASQAANLLGEWDRRYTLDNRRAVLFEEAMRQLARRLWDELTPDPGDSTAFDIALPSDMMIAALMADPSNVWWDDRRTPRTEQRDQLLSAVLASSLDSTIKRYGNPDSDKWIWSNVRHANIRHLLGIAAFSRLEIPVPGGSGTLWPSTGNGGHGPSWRMVVELSTPRKAWAIYPGGQSGDPLSPRYDDRIAKWAKGELDTLRLPRSADALSAPQRTAEMRLLPAGRQ